MTFLLGLAGIAIKIWLWTRNNANRMLGRAEADRDRMKETLTRVENAQRARRRLLDNPTYFGSLRDKYNRDDK